MHSMRHKVVATLTGEWRKPDVAAMGPTFFLAVCVAATAAGAVTAIERHTPHCLSWDCVERNAAR